MPLSRAARARVPKPERRDGCSVRAAFSGARVMSAGVTPRHNHNVGGSAAGPAPGRAGFSGLLGGVKANVPLELCASCDETCWNSRTGVAGASHHARRAFRPRQYEAFSTALDTGNTDTDISGTTHPSLRS